MPWSSSLLGSVTTNLYAATLNHSFCPDAFFDPDLTWNTDDPNLTRCMEETVLTVGPLVVLLLTSAVWLPYQHFTGGSRSSFPERRPVLTLLFWAKVILHVVLVVNVICQFAQSVESHGWDGLFPSHYFHCVVLFVAYLFSLALTAYEKRKNFKISPPGFFFSLSLLVLSLPAFKSDIQALIEEDPLRWYDIILLASDVPVVFFLLICNCWADLDGSEDPKDPPETLASMLSILFFAWMDGLVWRGFKMPLTQEDLPKPSKYVHVETNVQTFQEEWSKQVAKRGVKFSSPTHDPEKDRVSLWPVLVKTYGGQAAYGLVLAVVHYILVFVNPQILKRLIAFVDSDQELWKGYIYTIILFGSSIVSTVTFHLFQQQLTITSLQMRTSVISQLYKKALRLSNEARRKYTVGEITNYMSVDSQRLVECYPFTALVIVNPLTILLACFFLYVELGPASLAGVAILIILLPFSVFTNGIVRKLQKVQLENKDSRIKLMNEILVGMKVLKLYAWEKPFMKRVEDIRNSEIEILKKCAKLFAFINFTFASSPTLVTVAVFSTYTAMDSSNVLTAEKIFVAISLFNIMRIPLVMLPWSIVETIKLFVSINRINKFLNANELDPEATSTELEDEANSIEIRNASFAWSKDLTPTLKDINIRVKRGSLIAVVGSVGSGKSSLLSAVLGEMENIKGNVSMKGSVAYVPQQAWIQNMSLKNNILFDKDFEEEKYKKVIDTCALTSDLEILNSRDDTEIGENGINLSGGQKQRVSLARAVYSDADVYLLDDPLSAVDAHVGKHIFDKVISTEDGILQTKTRILVTHAVHFLDRVDDILVVRNGVVAERGSYQELKAKKGEFSDFLDQYASSGTATPKSEKENGAEYVTESNDKKAVEPKKEMSENNSGDEKAGDLIEEEIALVGSVKWSVYLKYIKCIGYPTFIGLGFLYIFGQSLHAVANFWLSQWADKNDEDPANAGDNTALYLGVYGAIGAVESTSEYLRELSLFLACARASRIMHQRLLSGTFHSPMSFFDTNPIGRVINRFSSDIDSVDQTIPSCLTDFLWCMCDVIAVLVVISASTPMFMTVILPLFIIYFFIQKFYIATSRQLKRLQSISKSPIFAHFSESVTGAASIRAYQQEGRFQNESNGKVRANVKSYYLSLCSNRWLGTRIEILGNLVVLFASLFAVLARNQLSAGLAGLSISYALQIVDSLNWMLRMVCELENNSVAVERILEYTENTPEAPWENEEEDRKLPDVWPSRGEVEFVKYETRYREGLDLVLKGVDMSVGSEEKIGICGRTGAGKSSLTLSLFRIIEAAGGKILIDGVDISKLGLQKLRSSLTIIPQDPILFTGNLRFNLDPTGEHCDDQVWRALEHAHLKNYIASLTDGLNHEVSESGENFSVGQRQLLCLARALLRKTKILVLDEATAAVDLETDNLIQNTIREEFKNCTILTIAHRLNTIMDSTRVAVFSQGRLIEYDPPQKLISTESSAFKAMARDVSI